MDCEYVIKLLLTAAGTYFWAWWIVWDNENRKREAEKELLGDDD